MSYARKPAAETAWTIAAMRGSAAGLADAETTVSARIALAERMRRAFMKVPSRKYVRLHSLLPGRLTLHRLDGQPRPPPSVASRRARRQIYAVSSAGALGRLDARGRLVASEKFRGPVQATDPQRKP